MVGVVEKAGSDVLRPAASVKVGAFGHRGGGGGGGGLPRGSQAARANAGPGILPGGGCGRLDPSRKPGGCFVF